MNVKELHDLFASGEAYVACYGEHLIDDAVARDADAIATRATGLLAAAEGGEGTPETDIATMVTLCRLAPNEAADAIESGDHNDSDIEAVIHWVRHFPDAATLIEALHSERNALAARVRELEADIVKAERRAERLEGFLCAIFNNLDTYPPHAPGHCHSTPGIWDADNDSAIAGKRCEWCAKWSEIRGTLRADKGE